MLLYPDSKNRPFHYGTYPLEALQRDETIIPTEAKRSPVSGGKAASARGVVGIAAVKYRDLFSRFIKDDPVEKEAPVPTDLERRAVDIKGCAYFMDASQVGICRVPVNAWLEGSLPVKSQTHAIVILIEHPGLPDKDNIARKWVEGAVESSSEMRALEITACVAGHIRQMGFEARIHIAGDEKLDRERLAVLAGLCFRQEGDLANPFIKSGFTIAVVSTNYELHCDLPLASSASNACDRAYHKGVNGATSGRERARRKRRASHDSRYPMEQVKRIDRPTTLILDDEVPRVPKRAAFFERSLQGDLGEKSQRERARFSFKHPLGMSLLKVIRSMVRHQDGEVAPGMDSDAHSDPAANARGIKALSYFLGSDLTGICEIPRYAWNSHKEDGTPIEMYHKYAIVMLIDQGYETMEGASGDDWISGVQSMRGYLRGAEIAGVMGEVLRSQGIPARSQTNADSDVLHIPLVLWAGLGEMSRIGELVLNPFVGPRFKSVVLTTDMPLEVDRPIDFGLQTFCSKCHKCDRECPCDAIPHGDKVMFNGYEIWKPDVERCTRYRLTNSKGSACGRCMKTCPLNKVIDLDGALLTRLASWVGVNAMFLKPLIVPVAAWLDDWLGNGKRNPLKKWWFDHEIIDGVATDAKSTNERDIEPGKPVDIEGQKIAFYHADMMPAPDHPGVFSVDRKAALEAKDVLETPQEARIRSQGGGAKPAHYVPTPLIGDTVIEKRTPSPYDGD
ncbi:MAG: Fe-S protein [Pseudomonadota bacterium]|nr:Fe-S protein [Pseudomonadota bacterium]